MQFTVFYHIHFAMVNMSADRQYLYAAACAHPADQSARNARTCMRNAAVKVME